MKELYIKQKVFSLSGKFTVKDQQENDVYFVEGSFMQIPKTFTIMNAARDEVALITKKTFSFLPKFFVEVNGREIMTIKKELSFFSRKLSSYILVNVSFVSAINTSVATCSRGRYTSIVSGVIP